MASGINLKCFKATWNGVNEKGELPSRLKLFDWGINKTNQGDFIVDEGTHRVFSENQTKLARNSVAIDFNHNTVEGTAAFLAAAGSPEIAGYGVPISIFGQGIFLEKIDTTPSGISKAADYKDLSPAPLTDKDNRVIGLHSVALTPTGSMDGLTLEASAQRALSASCASLSVPETQTNKSMATETETVVKPLSADDITKLFEAQLKPLTAQILKLEGDLDTRAKAMEKTERETVIAQAATQGKVIPLSAATLEVMPLAQVKELIAALKPNVVPLSPKLRVLNADMTKVEKKTMRDSADAINQQIEKQYGASFLNIRN